MAEVRVEDGWLEESGSQRRISEGYAKSRQVAKMWSREGKWGRGNDSKGARTVRLKIMKCMVFNTVLSLGRSRVWTRRQMQSVQRVLNYVVRRVMGMDTYGLHEWSLRDFDLYHSVGLGKCRAGHP